MGVRGGVCGCMINCDFLEEVFSEGIGVRKEEKVCQESDGGGVQKRKVRDGKETL